jgi:6-hydroxytryprostatin B O-methyltransferase
LAVLLRFDIAQSVPLGTGIPATDLAKAVGLPECILSRIVRYAIGNGIFCEPTPGTFSHNASSALLARNEHIRNIAVTSTRELSSILLRLGDALKQQLENGTEGAPQAAFNLAYSGYPSIFEFLAKNPDSAQRYHKYMVGRANTSRWKIDHMLNAYDWNAVGSMTIIDVRIFSETSLLPLLKV